MQAKPVILIIEKEEAEINKLKTVLGGLYKLEIIETTVEAVTKINDNKQKYSIIIVGLDMPILNGYLFCQTLKKDIDVRDIPIIITGLEIDFDKVAQIDGLRMGEFDRLMKPFENKMILSLVEINIEKKKMFQRMQTADYFDVNTNLCKPEFFREILNLEILKASKLKIGLNCLAMRVDTSEARENLLALIKSTCRHYDIASEIGDKIFFVFPRTDTKAGEIIFNRFNSLIYGLNIQSYYYEPGKTDPKEFAADVLDDNLVNL